LWNKYFFDVVTDHCLHVGQDSLQHHHDLSGGKLRNAAKKNWFQVISITHDKHWTKNKRASYSISSPAGEIIGGE
jgi:hypothetical protein